MTIKDKVAEDLQEDSTGGDDVLAQLNKYGVAFMDSRHEKKPLLHLCVHKIQLKRFQISTTTRLIDLTSRFNGQMLMK